MKLASLSFILKGFVCVATKSSLRGEAEPRRGNLRNFILFSRLLRRFAPRNDDLVATPQSRLEKILIILYNLQDFYKVILVTITITDRAFQRVCELIELEKDENLVLRVSVDSGGCSGLMYNYELVSKDNIEQDEYVITKHNATIIIDPISQKFMLDCTLDFIEELGSSYFNVSNPQAKAKCGCGNSFSV